MISAFPFFTQEAFAGPRIVIRYKVTYRVKYKASKKKKRPKLSEKKATTTVGEIYSIKLSNAKGKKIKWSSSNKRIASVKRDGNWCDITAKKTGKVTIIAKYKGKKYKCKLTIKPKKAEAFTLFYGSDLVFKNDGYGIGFDPSIALLSFRSNVHPLTMHCQVEDPSIADIEWDPGDNLDLWVTPKREGTTWITATNSYNSQTMRIKVVVGCGYDRRALKLDNPNVSFSDCNSEKTIKITIPNDVTKIDYSIDNDVCEVSWIEWKNGYCIVHIRPL